MSEAVERSGRGVRSAMRAVLGIGIVAALISTGPEVASASDHNEPAPDPVWPASKALHKEWDISDLFAWFDRERDTLEIIVAWHPQQLPRSPGQQTTYSDQVLYSIHVDYERAGAQLIGPGYFDAQIDFRYGQNDEGKWGLLVEGLPNLDGVVLDCESDVGWRAHAVDIETGDTMDLEAAGDQRGAMIEIATGMFDDPFVFDLDGYNASLTRALAGEVGLKFDPKNDTFEGHNVTAFVVSIPVTALEEHWQDFDRSGLFSTEDLHVWVTTDITDALAAQEGQ